MFGASPSRATNLSAILFQLWKADTSWGACRMLAYFASAG